MNWLTDHGWAAWLGLAIALTAIEVASVDFVFLMLAGGALGGALAAALGVNVYVQTVVAVILAVVLLFVMRPMLKRRFTVPLGIHRIGTAGQIGRPALVVETVTTRDGRVRLSGEIWSARLAPGTGQCLPGQEVRVVAIEGATAIVTRVAAPKAEEAL